MAEEDVLTPGEAGDLLGLPAPVVREELKAGRLIGVKENGLWRINRSEIDRYLEVAGLTLEQIQGLHTDVRIRYQLRTMRPN